MAKPPQFKICNQCGAICEATINRCPGFKTIPKSDPCLSLDFSNITIEELMGMAHDGKIRSYFQKWPEWPTQDAWHQLSPKEGLKTGLK